MSEARVHFDLSPLQAFVAGIKHPVPPLRKVFHKWAVRYSAYVRREFVKNSRGGGDWPALALSTAKRRRQGKTKTDAVSLFRKDGKLVPYNMMRVAILRDTGTLFNAINIGNPGNYLEDIPNGIRFGFAEVRHGEGGRATIRDIATFHDLGGKNLPQRIILREPDGPLIAAMLRDLGLGIEALGQRVSATRVKL